MTEPLARPERIGLPVRPVAKTPRDAPPLSGEYHKARKQLMFWSAILLIWSLIGVDLDKAKDAEGGVGAVVKSIKSPQAVPWAFVVLAGYFAFKFTVEWFQCNAARRRHRAARVDFVSAWVVLAVSNLLYFGQLIGRVQLADVLQGSNQWQSALAGAFTGLALGFGLSNMLASDDAKRAEGCLLYTLGAAIALGLITITVLTSGAFNWKYFTIAGISGAALTIVSYVIYSVRLARRSRATHTPMKAEKY